VFARIAAGRYANVWWQDSLMTVTLITKLDEVGATNYQNHDRFIMYACQKDNEHQENWTKWELILRISK